MAVETLMFKLEGAKQAAEISSLAGKTFTVGKVTGVGNGLGNGLFKWLFLVPSGGAAGNTVALKIEGGRQAAQLAGLAGKTVTVGHSPTMIGGMSHWLVLNTGGGAAAAGAVGAVGVTAKGGAGSKLLLMQLEGTQQAAQIKALAGKTLTVIPSPMVGGSAKGWLFLKPLGGAGIAGQDLVALQVQGGTQASLSGLIGKSFTLGKAPLATGNVSGSWIVLKPVGGVAAKGVAAGATVAAKGGVVTLPPFDGWTEFGAAKATGTTKVAAVQGGMAAAKPLATKALAGGSSAAGGAVVATAAKSGTLWNGTGWSLGLGLGLGPWGPVLLAGLLTAVGYGTYRYYRTRQELDAESEMVEAG
ncbi:MAG: hypothetical protein HQL87_02935 [Magnetococcales bacterium]|nr:hypothetical protein [Magnetococcales bacterium]